MSEDLIASPNDLSISVGPSWMELFTLVGIALIVFLILVCIIAVIRRVFNAPEMHGLTREEITRRWNEITRVAATGALGSKMAIVEADKLLDGVLKSMAMAGDTMGERLKFAGYKYPDLRKVWYAHKLRNQIVHETTFDIAHGQAKSAIQDYHRALKTLRAL